MIDIEDTTFTRHPDESTDSYIDRCIMLKDAENVTWADIIDIIYANTLVKKSEKTLRKRRNQLLDELEQTNECEEHSDEDSPQEIIQNLIHDLKVERIKLHEERLQNNAYIRKIAREETVKEIAANFAREMSSKKLLAPCKEPEIVTNNVENIREGTLCISDWHYGIEINNYFNTYNPEICRERVSELLHEVIEIGEREGIRNINVVNLSDLIAGRIHLKLRLESREDVISQTMEVAEILAEFLTELSEHFNKVTYYDTLDNHSRLEPNKQDSLELETLVRIIPWYLNERLAEYPRILIHENTYADDIITFDIFGFKVAATHGHKDKPNKVIENMAAMTRRRNDLVLTAHFHHFSADEEHEMLRISNGSLMGTDQYANDLRLTSKPSQNFIISTPDNVMEVLYKITLTT